MLQLLSYPTPTYVAMGTSPPVLRTLESMVKHSTLPNTLETISRNNTTEYDIGFLRMRDY